MSNYQKTFWAWLVLGSGCTAEINFVHAAMAVLRGEASWLSYH